MRTATAIRTGLVLAVAVVLGLMVAPAAHAVWSVFVPSNIGTIQAANFSVQLTDVPSNVQTEMAPGAEIPLTVINGLYPGGSVTTGVHVKNATDAGSDFSIVASIAGEEEIPSALVSYLTLKYATPINPAQQCATLDAAHYKDRDEFAATIAKGDTAVLCIRVELSSAALKIPAVDSARIAVPLQAAQIGRTP